MKNTAIETAKELLSLGKQAGQHTLAWGKKKSKKITKWTIVGLVSLTVVGGGVAAAVTYADYRLDKQASEAQTTLILNQAQGENITLKTPDEIKGIVAQAVGKDQGSLWFQEVELFNGLATSNYDNWYDRDWDDRFDYDDDNRLERGFVGSQNNNQTNLSQSQEYVYHVEAREKLMKYDLTIDAKTGKVLSSRIDNF